jgi:tetratricopeptide (TPR) repeat protein
VGAVKRSHLVFGAIGALIVTGALVLRDPAGADVPRTPRDDGEVLERLPLRASDPRERQREVLHVELSAHPDDLRTALTLARLDIELSRARSDPRYLGYAQAALGAWWDLAAPPPAVLVLRATIRQSTHDFDGALADLDRVVATTPGDAQAWITRSVVLSVRGRYDEARASCQPLVRLAPPLVYAVCETAIDGVTGAAGAAYDRLSLAIKPSRGLSADESADEREWATSTLGEIALRRGRDDDAETAFKAALTIDPDDAYVLAAYADLLLDRARPAEAIELVGGRTDNDGLLLRLALAEAKARAPGAPAHAEMLRARFAASHLRGDTVHRREEARFQLDLEGNAPAALALARANWDVQREPWDVRILLAAALAAGDPAAAAPALAFLDEHHLEDPRIRALAAQLRGAR